MKGKRRGRSVAGPEVNRGRAVRAPRRPLTVTTPVCEGVTADGIVGTTDE